MATIGSNIKQRREELGLTQEELAKKMGYKSKSTINKIEAGINDITQSKVIAFAKVLNTTVAYLMGWDDRILSLDEYNKKVAKQVWKDFIRLIESVGYEITELENDKYEIVSDRSNNVIIVTKEQLRSLDTTIMNYISYTTDKFFDEHSNTAKN
jgi:transcriptional regulator with XRE-family HTH domain